MFYYIDTYKENANNNVKIITVTKSISSKSELLKQFSTVLEFPYPYSTSVTNYDAFCDVLIELDWLKEEEIVIYHDSLPALEERTLAVYLDVLNQVDVEWETYEEFAENRRNYMISRGQIIPPDCNLNQKPKIFNVYFRKEDKEYVESLLKRYSKDYRKYIRYDD